MKDPNKGPRFLNQVPTLGFCGLLGYFVCGILASLGGFKDKSFSGFDKQLRELCQRVFVGFAGAVWFSCIAP